MTSFALHADYFVLADALVQGGYQIVTDACFGAWQEKAPQCEVIDLGDAIVAPGLVDTHIHGFFGHATTDNDAAGMRAASAELARRGTTSWLPTTFTQDADDLSASCAAIDKAAKEQEASCVAPAALAEARIQGIYLEGPFFTEAHMGAQNPAFLIDPDIELLKRWQEAAGGRIVKSALAPERAGALEYIKSACAAGIVCCIGHTDASYDQALRAVEAGASCFVHAYNGMRGLHHREPGVVGCAFATRNTYAELICDGHHVAPGAVAALVNAKGWDHVALITDCLGCGGLPDGIYMSGGLSVVLSGGVCHLLDAAGNSGSLAGSVLTLAEAVKNVVDWGVATPQQAIRMATEVPARAAGIADRCGFIAPGRAADFVVFKTDLTLRATYVGGKLVE